MTEDKAIKLSLGQWEKRILPYGEREEAETRAIQTISMLYLNGYEVVPARWPTIELGEIERGKQEGAIY